MRSASAPYEVFLKYLPPQCDEEQVSAFFSGCGDFEAPKLMRDPVRWEPRPPPPRPGPRGLLRATRGVRRLAHPTAHAAQPPRPPKENDGLPSESRVPRRAPLGAAQVSQRVIRGFVVFKTAEGLRQALSRSLERIGPRSVEVTVATTKGTMQVGRLRLCRRPRARAFASSALGAPSESTQVGARGLFGH